MVALQSHRGPDATGILQDGDVTLGHARLSIIDPREHSNQPFQSTDGRFVVSFNGEIYNHVEIRAELSRAGSSFRTTSDTEVLLESYRALGARFLDGLEGMFAFAIYDRQTGVLFCARDRLGEKPFYYTWCPAQGLTFASELSALVSVSPKPGGLDHMAVRSFLSTAYSKSPATLLSNVRQLPAGHYLRMERNAAPKIECYWSPVNAAVHAASASPCGGEEFLATFDRAVRLCTTSDVPFGAFLSGGLDSSAVIESVVHQGLGGGAFGSYTLDYQEPSYSESAVAARTATALGIKSEVVPYEDCESELPQIIRLAACVPIADPSFVPLFIVARAAKSKFKVMLGGDGGDELLLGYDTYRATWLSNALRPINLMPLQSLLRMFVNPASLFAKNVSATEKLWRMATFHVPGYPIRSHVAWRTIFSEAEIRELCPEESGLDTTEWLLQQVAGPAGWPFDASLPILTRAALIDYCSWLSDGVLRKLDSALMYNSVEGRSPFLNHALIQTGFRLRARERATMTKGKLPLRRRLDRAGLSHVCAQQKRGFGFPLDYLFRTSLRTMLFDELTSESIVGIFQRNVVARYLREHDEGLANHGRKLYSLLVLAIWFGHIARLRRDA